MKHSRFFVGKGVRVAVVVLAMVILYGCNRKEQAPGLDFLIRTEPTAYDGASVSDDRITELTKEVAGHQDAIEELVSRMSRTAVSQKLLGEAYLRREMYEPALKALEAAMAIQTENAVLYYWAAVASARSAKAHPADRSRFLELANGYYESALMIRPDYKDALYGISVLLAFELDRPAEALPHIRHLAAMETASVDIRFLFANILVRVEQFEEAIEIYDDLGKSAPSEVTRRQALENKDQLMRELAR